jgi:hypothetical protein
LLFFVTNFNSADHRTQTAARAEANLRIALQFSSRRLRDVRQIISYPKSVSAHSSDCRFLPASFTISELPGFAPGEPLAGIPGTVDHTTGELLFAVPFAIYTAFDILAAYGDVATELSNVGRSLAAAIFVHGRDAGNANTTLQSIDHLLQTGLGKDHNLSQAFGPATLDLCQSPSKFPPEYLKQFDEITKSRHKTEKARAPLRASAQTSIVAYRHGSEELAKALQAINQAIKARFSTLVASFRKAADRSMRAGNAGLLLVEKLDFCADFDAFTERMNSVNFDLPDLEFEPYSKASPGFAGQPPLQVPVPLDYPIGMAKIVCDHCAARANQIRIKVGTSIFLMEAITQDWVYVLNPNTLIIGFVPAFCLDPVCCGLAVMLREHGEAAIGDWGPSSKRENTEHTP